MNSVSPLPNVKICTKCKKYQDLSCFRVRKNRKNALTSWCVACLRRKCKHNYLVNRKKRVKYLREYHEENKHTVAKRKRAQWADPRNRRSIWLCALRRKSLNKGIKFNLTLEDIVIPEYCPVLGVLLNFDCTSPNCATMDKIVPSKGYVKGNVIVVSKRANQIKSDATVAEIMKVAEFYGQFGS